MEDGPKQEQSKLMGVRGHYVFVADIIKVMNGILSDAEVSKGKIALIGNPESKKLEGIIMCIKGIKDSMYSLEKYGVFIPMAEPKEDIPNADTVVPEDTKPAEPEGPKLILPS